MRILVAYSSTTGNTRKIAESIHLALPDADLCPVSNAPNIANYDVIFAGFWVERENACEEMRGFLKKLDGKPVALFATLGAYPDSQHALASLKAAAGEVAGGNVIDRFICQGAIDPNIIDWMEQLPDDSENAPTETRRQLWKDAETHPDDTDLKNAATWAANVLQKI
ncbi:MAG TPA: flavodoxin family protein [Pontiella sp.]